MDRKKKTLLASTAAVASLASSLIIIPSASASEPATCTKGTTWSSADNACLKPKYETYAQGRAKGVDSLTFYDKNGNPTDSGMSARDTFQLTGIAATPKGKDGKETMLVEVRQTSRGQGGWGPSYQGFVLMKYVDFD